MAEKDYTELAEAVVAAVGGKENISNVTNCMTRLRFVLKDEGLADDEAVQAIDGVKGVMRQGGQYQVIIGTHVTNVLPFVKKVVGTGEGAPNAAEDASAQGSLFQRFFKVISGCITPIIGPMIAGGIIKGILIICTTLGVLSQADGAYQLWYASADAALYFMPVIVGFAAGRVFGCNQMVTAVIGAAFLYPALVEAVGAEGGLTFFGLPIANTSYANTLFPVILSSYLASLVEKGAKKVLPEMLHLMMVPTVTLFVVVPLGWVVIGPVMNALSNAISAAVTGIFSISPLLAGVVLGAFWQVIVLTGLHGALIPILINNLITMGSDPLNAILGLTVWALAGVSLGYALKMKDANKRAEGFSNVATCLCGVTEPTIYSIALPQPKCFVAAWIGGGIAGGILAMLGGRLYALAGDGLFRIPGMINPAGPDISLYGFIGCALLAAGISAVLAYFVADPEK